MAYTKVTIQQLDEHGNVYRTFNRYSTDLDSTLAQIQRAFNMDRTVITIAPEGTARNNARV